MHDLTPANIETRLSFWSKVSHWCVY